MGNSQSTKLEEFLRSSDVPVLVDFYADWCGPCKMMAPILKDLKSAWGDKVKIVKVDTEAQPDIARRYQISGIPTLILFKKGEAMHRTSGVMPVTKLQQEYENFL